MGLSAQMNLLLAIVSSASMSIVMKCFPAGEGNRYAIILGNYLTCLNYAVIVNVQLTYYTTHLSTNIYAGNRFNGTCGCNAGYYVLLHYFYLVVCETWCFLATAHYHDCCCKDRCCLDESLSSHLCIFCIIFTLVCYRSIFSPV